MAEEPSGMISKVWHGLSRTWSSKNDLVAEDPYKFQPLRTSTTIRLIKICRKMVKGCIACKIYHFDEQEHSTIRYQALSYVWGDSRPTRLIFLKSSKARSSKDRWHPFPLHENLWEFLSHAWRQKMFGQFLWTDRLCLNQDNHEEISKQVPRMRAIYQDAGLVLIWLRLKEEEEQYLLELLRLYHHQHRAPESWHSLEQRRASFDQDVFFGLIGNSYWTRIWVVQEIVVSRAVCVIFRDSLIPLEELALVFGRLWDGRFYHRPWIWALCDLRAAGKRPLSKILIEFSGYQSSRPADRVYGMLGMIKDNEDGSSPTDNIQVDYDRPVPCVFLDAMFESSPVLEDYVRLPECLRDWEEVDSYSLLESYVEDSNTIQKHKGLAHIALQALEVFNIIKSVPGAPDEDIRFPIAYETLSFSGAPDEDIGFAIVNEALSIPAAPFNYKPSNKKLFSAVWPWKPTLEQHAAMIGLALAPSSSGPLNDWKARWRMRHKPPTPEPDALRSLEWDAVSQSFYRLRGADPSSRRMSGSASSPWRCATHGSVDNALAGMSSYGPIIAMTKNVWWAPEGVVEACGERSLRCDGSILTCEIPEVGLRLVVSSNRQLKGLILQRGE